MPRFSVASASPQLEKNPADQQRPLSLKHRSPPESGDSGVTSPVRGISAWSLYAIFHKMSWLETRHCRLVCVTRRPVVEQLQPTLDGDKSGRFYFLWRKAEPAFPQAVLPSNVLESGQPPLQFLSILQILLGAHFCSELPCAATTRGKAQSTVKPMVFGSAI